MSHTAAAASPVRRHPNLTTAAATALRMPPPTDDRYQIIAGALRVVGRSPDGDSIAFVPDTPLASHRTPTTAAAVPTAANIAASRSRFAGLRRGALLRVATSDGAVQLRLEGIDAPELHYGGSRQSYAMAARDALLARVGFTDLDYRVARIPNGTAPTTLVDGASPLLLPAFIATKACDPHGRPIAYLFMGSPASIGATDGDTGVQLSDATLATSVNYGMVADGFAYLLTYTSMPTAHVALFRTAANAARTARKNIWEIDATASFRIENRADISREQSDTAALIYPKFFRRATDYLRAVAVSGFEGDFGDWLIVKSSENDRIFTNLGAGALVLTPLSALFRMSAGSPQIAFTADLNNLLFVER